MSAGKVFFVLASLLLSAMMQPACAQPGRPILERIISVKVSGEPLENVLDQISKQGKFSFSYNPDAIPVKKSVTISMNNKTVREALDQLLADEVSYKIKGSHVILTRAPAGQQSTVPPYYFISGYVINGTNGEKIPEVSVFDKANRSSSVTNDYGYYELKVDRKVNTVQLIVNKSQFRDTLVYIKQAGNATVNVTIFPEEAALQPIDSLSLKKEQLEEDQLAFIEFMLSEEQKANTKNIRDTLYKKVQVTFLPFVGSNLRLSGNTVSDYSFNVLAGYSMGTRKMEIGGLINVARDSVQSLQVAGLINATGGPVSGVQIGGLINANLETMKGVQLGGLINSNGDSLKGVQLGGLINANLKTASGVTVGGLLNVNLGSVEGVQVAGLLNVALDSMKGLQAAGLLNVALKDIKGSQVSGLVNVARRVSGFQLGFLNLSDTCSGIPLGFLSFSYRGYHPIEISADEIFAANLSWRTGVRSFYNIFSAGIKPGKYNNPLWHFGYGVGTSIRLGRTWWLNLDLTTQQLVKGSSFEEMNMLSKFHLLLDKSITKKFAIAFGPVFNFYTSNTTVPYYDSTFDRLAPYTFSDESYSNNLNIKTWIGGKLAIRIL